MRAALDRTLQPKLSSESVTAGAATDSNYSDGFSASDAKLITKKHTEKGADENITFGVGEMQGWRPTMEDAHTTILDLGTGFPCALFGVYDGHSGAAVSKLCTTEIPKRMKEEFKGLSEIPDVQVITSAIKGAFTRFDEDLISGKWNFGSPYPGSTAVVAVITPNDIVVGNTGDSRCVISRRGKLMSMTKDQKPMLQAELMRIKRTDFEVSSNSGGGSVKGLMPDSNSDADSDYRYLAMSRSLGDIGFKRDPERSREEQAVIADPFVTSVPHIGVEFMVLACDGIFDAMTNKEVVRFVQHRLGRQSLDRICKSMMMRAVARKRGAKGSTDNMTVCIVQFLNRAQDGQPESGMIRPGASFRVLSGSASSIAISPRKRKKPDAETGESPVKGKKAKRGKKSKKSKSRRGGKIPKDKNQSGHQILVNTTSTSREDEEADKKKKKNKKPDKAKDGKKEKSSSSDKAKTKTLPTRAAASAPVRPKQQFGACCGGRPE